MVDYLQQLYDNIPEGVEWKHGLSEIMGAIHGFWKEFKLGDSIGVVESEFTISVSTMKAVSSHGRSYEMKTDPEKPEDRARVRRFNQVRTEYFTCLQEMME